MKLVICAPDIVEGDAVGNHCLGIARFGERIGLETEIFAQRYRASSHPIRDIDEIFRNIKPEDVLIVSYSIYDSLLEKLLDLSCRKICYFHGVTDPELLRDFEPLTANLCALSLKQFPMLSKFDLIIANSMHSKAVLTRYIGATRVKIIPPVFPDMPVFKHRAGKSRRSSEDFHNIVIVGRVVPHKSIEDAIAILSDIRTLSINAKLTIVGATPNQMYYNYLIDCARDLRIVEYIEFKGILSDEELFKCYENASALLSVSRHEGFCVPVIEAMHFELPVFVRYGTAAIETAQNACIEFKDLKEAANLIVSTLKDPIQCKNLRLAGKTRVQNILNMTNDRAFSSLLTILH